MDGQMQPRLAIGRDIDNMPRLREALFDIDSDLLIVLDHQDTHRYCPEVVFVLLFKKPACQGQTLHPLYHEAAKADKRRHSPASLRAVFKRMDVFEG
jgi:hypothetical protein